MKSAGKYIRCFNIGVQSAMEYRSNFLLSALSAVFPIIIQLFLWTAIFKNSSNSVIYGYSYYQIINYTILANLISKLLSTGFEYEVSDDIKTGGLNKFIVQPISYFRYRFSRFLGAKFIELVMILLMILGVLVIINNYLGIVLSFKQVIMFIVSIILAVIMNFLIFFCLSTFSFWLTDAWGLFFGANFLFSIMGGGVFPLDIFPKEILQILDYLPFKFTIYYPINILLGKVEFNMAIKGFITLIIWIVVLYILLKTLWIRGLKKYVAVGG